MDYETVGALADRLDGINDRLTKLTKTQEEANFLKKIELQMKLAEMRSNSNFVSEDALKEWALEVTT